MAKDKPKKDKAKKTPTKPAPPKITLKEKINKTVEDHHEDKEALKKQIFSLFQRVLYPDQFCPDCDDRLFFNGQIYDCPNCGYQRTMGGEAPAPTGVRPSQGGKVPPQVEKMISQSQENMKEPRRVVAPTTKGANIKKLVDQMDSGGSNAPTPTDEAAVKRDKNVSGQINWV